MFLIIPWVVDSVFVSAGGEPLFAQSFLQLSMGAAQTSCEGLFDTIQQSYTKTPSILPYWVQSYYYPATTSQADLQKANKTLEGNTPPQGSVAVKTNPSQQNPESKKPVPPISRIQPSKTNNNSPSPK
jgi:hypothetical protein